MYSHRTFKKGLQGTRPCAKNAIPDRTVPKGISIMPSNHNLKPRLLWGLGDEVGRSRLFNQGGGYVKTDLRSSVAIWAKVQELASKATASGGSIHAHAQFVLRQPP